MRSDQLSGVIASPDVGLGASRMPCLCPIAIVGVPEVFGSVVLVAVGAPEPAGIAARFQRLLAPMQQHVIGVILADDQILRRVVEFVSVPVMDDRAARQRLSQRFFSNQPVFPDIAARARKWVIGPVQVSVSASDVDTAFPIRCFLALTVWIRSRCGSLWHAIHNSRYLWEAANA